MTRIKGKEQLCSCEKKYFKSFQGFGDRTLIDRYPDIESIVVKKVSEKYRHFLAEPDDEGDTITWYSKPYQETPRRFSELNEEDKVIYEQIKNDTLAHYQKVIGELKRENQTSEAEALEGALKYINEDFIFCYDEAVVLGTWGMQLKENFRESLGTISKNLFKIKKKAPVVPPAVEEVPQEQEEVAQAEESPLQIRFDAGEQGQLIGTSEFQKAKGESIAEHEIPKVEPKAGYQFTGWDINPSNFLAEGDAVFTAQYTPIVPPVVAALPWYTRLWNWIRNFLFSRGCLRWLLWLLLFLLLLFLLLWLLQCCERESKKLEDCSERIEDLERQIDSLNRSHKEYRDSVAITDSLEFDAIQEELDSISTAIFFEGNTDNIIEYSEQQLNAIVEKLNRINGWKLEVRGYCSCCTSQGDPELDDQRANKVKELLIGKGIPPESIHANGLGDSNLVPCNRKLIKWINGRRIIWNENMRVEIKISRI